MVEYFKKLKEAINQPQAAQQFGIVEDIKEYGSMVNKIRNLEAQISELIKWKDSDAIPTMRKNIESINKSAIEVTNAMNKSIEASNLAQSALNNVNEALTKAVSASSVAQQAAEMANSSVVGAKEALTKATSIYEKFQLAAAQLAIDTKAIGTASNELIDSMGTEISAMRNAFIKFGADIGDSAKVVVGNMKYLKDEFVEAKDQIQYPLQFVKTYAKRCKDDALIYLPYNIFMMSYWGFLKIV